VSQMYGVAKKFACMMICACVSIEAAAQGFPNSIGGLVGGAIGGGGGGGLAGAIVAQTVSAVIQKILNSLTADEQKKRD